MARRPLALLAALLGLATVVAGCRFGGDEPEDADPAVFCEDHATIDANFASMPNQSLEELRDGLGQLAEEAEGLAGRAPDEVAGAAETLAVGLREASDAVAGAGTLDEARAAVAAVVDEGAYRAASDEVEGWVADNCATG